MEQFAQSTASTSTTKVPCDIFIPQNQHDPENAFDQIAPSSASTPADKGPYDVFINHRGEVKHTLASTIYHTLDLLGLRAFLDKEKLELGDVIPVEIQQTMASASLHIAIFSPNYAQSQWCLAELSFMLKTGSALIPVFYKVVPSDLKWIDQGKGIYAPAFLEHAKKGRYTSQKLDEWKEALNKISFHSGYIVNDNEDEGMRLKTIVNSALRLLANKRVPLDVAKHPVGLDELVKDFERAALASAQSQENVKIAGIVGMGGSGKTTLAKELFNRKSSNFDRCSFVSDVRDAAARHVLQTKQEILLKDLRVHFSPLDNIDQGKQILNQRLRSVRVLIVLDDVDHIDQLDSLLPKISSLGSHSLVIVTTRELGVLKLWDNVSFKYNMPGLKRLHAEQLFCWHAFLQPNPPFEFKNLVEKFLMACNGLPLSLKVFGGQLYGKKSQQYWESTFHKISRKLHLDIKQRLQISYDALDEEEREIFLDVACFFNGEEISLAIAVWDGCEWSGLHSWDILVNKCLVELDDNNCIKMHDQLRDMGKEIAGAHSPHRFWTSKQILDIHTHSQERIEIRGIADSGYRMQKHTFWDNFYSTIAIKEIVESSAKALKFFRSVCGLKILFVQEREFSEEIASLSEHIVWLSWYFFQDRNLPSWLSFRNLHVLELYGPVDLEELWEDNVEPPLQLRELRIIDGGSRLRRFASSIGRLKHLKKIIFRNVFGGSSLPKEFCGLQSLEHLELPGSEMLSSLPGGFGELISLRHIDLSDCKQLWILPNSFNKLVNLEYLDLHYCQFLSFRLNMLENITKLKFLNLQCCKLLEELPHQIINQLSLRELDISGCIRLREVPVNIGTLCKLETLRIGSPMLRSLPCSLANLSSLTTLDITSCKRLERLPHSMGRLNLLRKLTISSSGVRELPFGAGSSSTISNLKELKGKTKVPKISVCHVCCLASQTPSLIANTYLMENGSLPTSLGFISLEECKMLKNIRGVGGLLNLQTLYIFDCPELYELPSFENLAFLKVFHMRGCPKVEKLEGLEHCWSMRELKVYTCWKVPGLQSLRNLESLKQLELTCDNISAIKPGIQSMKELPRQMWISGRVVRFVKDIVESFMFPDVSVMRFGNSSQWHGLRNAVSEGHLPHSWKGPLLWYVEKNEELEGSDVSGISSFPLSLTESENEENESSPLFYRGKNEESEIENENEKGGSEDEKNERWVDIFVLSQDSFDFWPDQIISAKCKGKGMLVTGRGERILEAFYQLLALLE